LNQQAEDPGQGRPPTIFQTAASVLAAAFGVQSSKNRERDFKHGRASTFILAGIIFTVLLVLAIYLAVRLSLQAAGAG
jgi:asparagine N-glycosylation enzyme membrane subunit Stt3